MMRFFLSAAALGLAAGLVAPVAVSKQSDTHHGHDRAMADMEITTSIADGATLTMTPDRIDFTFTPAMRLSSVRLTTATGETIPVVFDAKAPPAKAARVMFGPLAQGSYTLIYNVDAGDHIMPGRVKFTVR